jgi:hypothetical protein
LRAVIALLLALAGCGNATNKGFDGESDDAGAEDATADGPSSSPGAIFGSEAGGGAQGPLAVVPSSALVNTVKPGTAGTQAFMATVGGSSASASWSIDDANLGTIDANGVFKASGSAAGTATITARAGGMTASATVTVHVKVTENPGNVPAATQATLTAGGHADASFRWLYPYDKTVFPRGLTPPVLQFDGANSTAVSVHVTSRNVDYTGYFAGANPDRVTWSAAAWRLITTGAEASDPVRVDVTKSDAAGVSGPISETWTVAQGTLTGTIYYNTYDSSLAAGGAVMRIKPGTPAQVLLGNCTTCHAVSADGSTLVANADDQMDQSYDLQADAGVIGMVTDGTWSFGAVYPNGSLVMESAGGQIPGTSAVGPSRLYDTKSAQPVTANGWDGVIDNALMPSFSPDGKQIAFSNFDVGQGHTLSVMSFDVASKTFSGLRDVATTTDTSNWLGWPAFLPSSSAFLFGNISGQDFATWDQDTGDLSIADVASKAVVPLDALNGGPAGQVYLPYGESEAHLNYEPTVLPVAVGGYYWTIFTSRREYGNTITDPDAWETDPARRKKLWVAAIDLSFTAGKDPSHPAFYLDDQELEAGNMRGFWALDPCAKTGLGCTTGDQCCTGFCRAGSGDAGSALVCVDPPAAGCAQEYEKCGAAMTCCGAAPGYECIDGYCARPAPK